MRASLPYSKNLPPGQTPGGRSCVWKLSLDYGVGDASEVVVDSVVLPSDVAGVIVAIGVDSAGVVVTVVLLVVVSDVVAGGFTTVVLFSVVSAGEAAGATVSVFCSHATRSAALARMQIYFFIGYG
jgi:hypothetical protein